MWKIIVAAAGTSALTAMVVASCLDRDSARRDAQEPAFVQTTSVTTTATPGTTPVTPAPQAAAVAVAPSPATRDTTGGVAAGGESADTAGTSTTSTSTTSTTTITSGPATTQGTARQLNYTRVPVPFESANGDTSTSGTNGSNGTSGADGSNGTGGARDAAPSATDGGATRNDDPRRVEDRNRGSNPQAPSYSAGAGGFVTEAPYWGASAWTSDPNAGAGPFTTERNTPAYGSYGVVGAPGPAR